MTTLFIFGAKYLIALSAIIAAGYFLAQPRAIQKQLFLLGIVSAALTAAAAFIASRLFVNPRPFVVGHFTPLIPHAADNGFPSDHALASALIASIVFPYNKKLGVFLWFLAILISISRVYVGVHHALDVLGGMAISAVMTWIAFGLLKNYQKKETTPTA